VTETTGRRRVQPAALIIAAGLVLLAAVMWWDAAALKQDGGYAGVGPADVPRIVAAGLVVLAVFTAIAGLRGTMPAPPPQRPVPVLWILAGLGLQLVLLGPAGFSIASGLLFGFTARGMGRRPLWLTCAVGVVMAAIVYVIFDRLLQLNLPGGPIERALFGG
jgi:putative tricarboxylic transport membrane protein